MGPNADTNRNCNIEFPLSFISKILATTPIPDEIVKKPIAGKKRKTYKTDRCLGNVDSKMLDTMHIIKEMIYRNFRPHDHSLTTNQRENQNHHHKT